MPLFSRGKPKSRPIEAEADHQPLDAVALCLAVWLGMMVCAFGLVRLSNDAAQRAALQDHSMPMTTPVYPVGFGS